MRNNNDYQSIASLKIQQLRNFFSSKNLTFIPSFEERHIIDSHQYKHLIFSHIPKCGGTVFMSPIRTLLRFLDSESGEHQKMLVTNDISKKYVLDGLLMLCREENGLSTNIFCNSMLSLHGATKCNEFNVSYKKLVSQNHNIVSLIRDPEERLYSQIAHEAASCHHINELRKRISQRVYDFDNTLSRYIFNFGLDGNETLRKPTLIINDIPSNYDIIHCKDQVSIDWYKSVFISVLGVPNIIHFKRMNTRENRDKAIEKWSRTY